ncbi:MAG: metal-sulfur cluster assembly factor [Candidatus Dormibacteria bacterium]
MSDSSTVTEGNLGAYNDEAPDGTAIPVAAEDVREALKAVMDPEIGIDIVNLGLIYDVAVSDNNIAVKMTLTGPGCPVGPMLQSQVYGIAAGMPGARNVQVDMVWTPPWDPRTMASEEAKDTLGIW